MYRVVKCMLIVLSISLLTSLNAFAGEVLGPELIPNGDAETGILNPAVFNLTNVSVVAADPNFPQLGNYSIKIGNGGNMSIWLGAEPNSKYRLTCTVYDMTTTDYGRIRLFVRNPVGIQWDLFKDLNISPTTAPVVYTIDTATDATSTMVVPDFNPTPFYLIPGTMRVDNISLRKIMEEPVADAGTGQVALAGDDVTLDGSGSTDADGTIVSYAWVGDHGTTASGVTATVTVTPGMNEVFTLTVTDNDGLTDTDTVRIKDIYFDIISVVDERLETLIGDLPSGLIKIDRDGSTKTVK